MTNQNKITVTIVGGGPVGLLLAICLIRKGIECTVLEKRTSPISDSRSLGIHPISLDLLDALGIGEKFLQEGVKIRKGIALNEKQILGEISFKTIPKPHTYILACPQFYTEQILRDELHKLDSNVLIPGAEFQSFDETEDSIITNYRFQNSNEQITSNYIIGCDGKNSLVRQQATIPYSGKRYPDTYVMGDFEDNTNFGKVAAVFLPKNGLIECFPLPNKKRRWVVKTDQYEKNPSKELLTELVQGRIGYHLTTATCEMLSSFGVHHLIAETFVKKRVLLAGDAAHVVSPIGGQGMNLGWLGAWRLADAFPNDLQGYYINHKKIVGKAAKRAELNMRLGRKTYFPALRNALVKRMLSWPLHYKTAELFTMRGLKDNILLKK